MNQFTPSRDGIADSIKLDISERAGLGADIEVDHMETWTTMTRLLLRDPKLSIDEKLTNANALSTPAMNGDDGNGCEVDDSLIWHRMSSLVFPGLAYRRPQ